MSFITRASGGDGWSTWEVERKGSACRITVYSKAETVRQPNPAGWGHRVLHDETVTDEIGRRAIDRALSLSSAYADRMAR